MRRANPMKLPPMANLQCESASSRGLISPSALKASFLYGNMMGGQWRNYIPHITLCRPMKIWNDDRWDDESAVKLDAKGHFRVIS